MRVELSPEAETDIEEIGHYIGLENPGRAASLTRELVAACHALGRFPLAAPVYPSGDSQSLRRKVFGRYLIFYRPTPTVVEIVRVLHGARDIPSILFPKDP